MVFSKNPREWEEADSKASGEKEGLSSWLFVAEINL